MSALDQQVGGDHYKKLKIQPITYILENNLGFAEGAVVKYVTRWRDKNGVEDLKKARHIIDLLIEAQGEPLKVGSLSQPDLVKSKPIPSRLIRYLWEHAKRNSEDVVLFDGENVVGFNDYNKLRDFLKSKQPTKSTPLRSPLHTLYGMTCNKDKLTSSMAGLNIADISWGNFGSDGYESVTLHLREKDVHEPCDKGLGVTKTEPTPILTPTLDSYLFEQVGDNPRRFKTVPGLVEYLEHFADRESEHIFNVINWTMADDLYSTLRDLVKNVNGCGSLEIKVELGCPQAMRRQIHVYVTPVKSVNVVPYQNPNFVGFYGSLVNADGVVIKQFDDNNSISASFHHIRLNDYNLIAIDNVNMTLDKFTDTFKKDIKALNLQCELFKLVTPHKGDMLVIKVTRHNGEHCNN